MRFRRVDVVTAWGVNGVDHGPHWERQLSAADIVELVARRRAGWTVDALAMCYGVSTRTIHRWKRAEVHEVRVGGYVAAFVTGHEVTCYPLQVTRWRREEAA